MRLSQIIALRAWLIVPFLVITLAACSSDDEKKSAGGSAEEMYRNGLNFLKKGKYKEATDAFEDLDTEYPQTFWASRAPILAAYSQYKNKEYDDAIDNLERFIKQNPNDPETSYAYYLRALSYYEQIVDVGKDQSITEKAFDLLKEVIKNYPNTKYAQDAQLRTDAARSFLAGKEMEIGRFYLKRHHYAAALGRFQKVIDNYQTTTHTAEALHRITECYIALGLYNEAGSVAAVLGYNYPGSSWYEKTYQLLLKNNIIAKVNDNSWIHDHWQQKLMPVTPPTPVETSTDDE